MKRIIILSAFALMVGKIFSQSNTINYYAPNCLYDSLSKYEKISEEELGCIWDEKGDYSILLIFKLEDNEELKSISKTSNRYLLLNQENSIPIIFKSDLKYSDYFNELQVDSVLAKDNMVISGYYVKMKGRFMAGEITEFYFSE